MYPLILIISFNNSEKDFQLVMGHLLPYLLETCHQKYHSSYLAQFQLIRLLATELFFTLQNLLNLFLDSFTQSTCPVH